MRNDRRLLVTVTYASLLYVLFDSVNTHESQRNVYFRRRNKKKSLKALLRVRDLALHNACAGHVACRRLPPMKMAVATPTLDV